MLSTNYEFAILAVRRKCARRSVGDDRIIVNLSVWESVGALADYVFASRHSEVLRRRREWFEKMETAHLALWWIRAGTIPSVGDAERPLGLLRERGPSPEAFTMREPFPAPGVERARPIAGPLVLPTR